MGLPISFRTLSKVDRVIRIETNTFQGVKNYDTFIQRVALVLDTEFLFRLHW